MEEDKILKILAQYTGHIQVRRDTTAHVMITETQNSTL